MPYTNAKVIYRVFREEKRIISYSKNITKEPTVREDYQLLQNYPMLRQDALIKLAKALNTELLTEPQRAKIYQQNFDEFISKPCINNLSNNGITYMGGNGVHIQGKFRCVLPMPTKSMIGPIVKSHSAETNAEEDACMKDEKEMVKEFIFPLR